MSLFIEINEVYAILSPLCFGIQAAKEKRLASNWQIVTGIMRYGISDLNSCNF